MTGSAPGSQPGLHRLATGRPVARRSALAAAALLGAGGLSGCVRRRRTAEAVVQRVTQRDSQGMVFTAHHLVAANHDSSALDIQEEGDRIVLLLHLTTSSGLLDSSSPASDRPVTFDFSLGSPRGKRPFVNGDGDPIPLD